MILTLIFFLVDKEFIAASGCCTIKHETFMRSHGFIKFYLKVV